jgi:Ca2+-binding RTX toxin-like protein
VSLQELGFFGSASGDTLFGIENLNGSNFGDTLYGNDLANTLNGFGGNDRLFGRRGKTH